MTSSQLVSIALHRYRGGHGFVSAKIAFTIVMSDQQHNTSSEGVAPSCSMQMKQAKLHPPGQPAALMRLFTL